MIASPLRAVADIGSGAPLTVGGFGLSGVPEALIQALYDQGADHLSVVSNNCGADGGGLGVLLAATVVLQSLHGLSDFDTVQMLRCDLRWKATSTRWP